MTCVLAVGEVVVVVVVVVVAEAVDIINILSLDVVLASL